LITVLLLVAAAAPGLDVVQVQWGIDGKVLADRPNPLAVLVGNPGAVAIEGSVELTCGSHPGSRQGVAWAVPLYLSPGARRWVHFAPWIDIDARTFTLTVRPSGQRLDLPEPPLGVPTAAYLRDGGRITPVNTAFARLDAELFPAAVGLTDGLTMLFIDHVPRWEAAQRRAFLDWLASGGQVHVLWGADGRPPRFTDDLAVLDHAGTVGAGRVSHLPRSAAGLTHADLGLPTPTRDEADESAARAMAVSAPIWPLLRELVRPDHAWWLIVLVLIAYVVVIGPGALIAGKRGLDWRWLNLALVATIAGTALLLAAIGRRGYGERTVTHSLTVARAVGPGTWDVTTWGQLFVTSSATWRIAHAGDARMYSCPGGDESIDGVATLGPEAALITGIPLYSGRTFTVRARIPGPAIAPTLLPAAPGRAITVSLPVGVAVRTAVAVRGDRVYDLVASPAAEGGSLLISGDDHDLAEWIQQGRQHALYNGPMHDPDASLAGLDLAFARLVAWSLVDASAASAATARPGLRVFVLADQPAEFRARIAGSAFEQGRVVYRFDLPSPPAEKP